MSEPTDILMSADSSDCPPWTDAQRDAQIEALRFAYLQLVRALHCKGILDMAEIELDAAEWQLSHNPESREAARWYETTLAYMRSKLGDAGDDA